jgi:hypothetical protein
MKLVVLKSGVHSTIARIKSDSPFTAIVNKIIISEKRLNISIALIPQFGARVAAVLDDTIFHYIAAGAQRQTALWRVFIALVASVNPAVANCIKAQKSGCTAGSYWLPTAGKLAVFNRARTALIYHYRLIGGIVEITLAYNRIKCLVTTAVIGNGVLTNVRVGDIFYDIPITILNVYSFGET